ncbi:MAG TPA: homocysteine S-methyltransferase family protein [Devosia sp.]|nr:homocysteine S-methyltransferase family protein [Devosia sp.]
MRSQEPRAGRIYVTDGGIETDIIFNRGVDLPHFSAFPLNDSAAGRDVIRGYYRDYLPAVRAAGAPFLFATDTWRASSDWADRLGYDRALLAQNSRTAVALCAELADEFAAAGVASAITGILGPRRDAWQHDAAMTIGEAYDYHAPQIEAFADTVAGSIQAYTLTNTPEAIGIARAAKAMDLSVMLSFTVETNGNLPGGKPLGTAIAEVDAATGAHAEYFMVNCAHPSHFAEPLMSGEAWVQRIGGLRANASRKSHAELDQSPDIDIGDINELAHGHAELMPALPNLRLIGGCCGTDHRHIGALCAHVLPHAAG